MRAKFGGLVLPSSAAGCRLHEVCEPGAAGWRVRDQFATTRIQPLADTSPAGEAEFASWTLLEVLRLTEPVNPQKLCATLLPI
jgi:hypothetical protein